MSALQLQRIIKISSSFTAFACFCVIVTNDNNNGFDDDDDHNNDGHGDDNYDYNDDNSNDDGNWITVKQIEKNQAGEMKLEELYRNLQKGKEVKFPGISVPLL